MDYLLKSFTPHKLTVTHDLERKHNAYKKCIADKIENYMQTGQGIESEICLEEKQRFYNTLHETKKIEHDNLQKYYLEKVKMN